MNDLEVPNECSKRRVGTGGAAGTARVEAPCLLRGGSRWDVSVCNSAAHPGAAVAPAPDAPASCCCCCLLLLLLPAAANCSSCACACACACSCSSSSSFRSFCTRMNVNFARIELARACRLHTHPWHLWVAGDSGCIHLLSPGEIYFLRPWAIGHPRGPIPVRFLCRVCCATQGHRLSEAIR